MSNSSVTEIFASVTVDLVSPEAVADKSFSVEFVGEQTAVTVTHIVALEDRHEATNEYVTTNATYVAARSWTPAVYTILPPEINKITNTSFTQALYVEKGDLAQTAQFLRNWQADAAEAIIVVHGSNMLDQLRRVILYDYASGHRQIQAAFGESAARAWINGNSAQNMSAFAVYSEQLNSASIFSKGVPFIELDNNAWLRTILNGEQTIAIYCSANKSETLRFDYDIDVIMTPLSRRTVPVTETLTFSNNNSISIKYPYGSPNILQKTVISSFIDELGNAVDIPTWEPKKYTFETPNPCYGTLTVTYMQEASFYKFTFPSGIDLIKQRDPAKASRIIKKWRDGTTKSFTQRLMDSQAATLADFLKYGEQITASDMLTVSVTILGKGVFNQLSFERKLNPSALSGCKITTVVDSHIETVPILNPSRDITKPSTADIIGQAQVTRSVTTLSSSGELVKTVYPSANRPI